MRLNRKPLNRCRNRMLHHAQIANKGGKQNFAASANMEFVNGESRPSSKRESGVFCGAESKSEPILLDWCTMPESPQSSLRQRFHQQDYAIANVHRFI